MGHKGKGFEIPSKFWLSVAKKELKRATHNLKGKDYPDCVFHSQQAVEKAVKALLEINGIIVRDHYVSRHLDKLTGVEIERLKEIAVWFEMDKKWESARYPIEKGGKILMPEDVFTEEIARDALKKARYVVREISKILREKYGVECIL